MRACCDLQASGRSLRRDRSALRGFRGLTPFGECLSLLGLDTMQVISLEGCNSSWILGCESMFGPSGHLSCNLSANALASVFAARPPGTARILCTRTTCRLATKQNVSHLKIRSCNVAGRKRHGRRHLRRRGYVCSRPDDFRNARQT